MTALFLSARSLAVTPSLSAVTRIGVPCSSVPLTIRTWVSGHPHVPAEDVGGHAETGDVADVARAVGVRPGDCGEDVGHGGSPSDGSPAAFRGAAHETVVGHADTHRRGPPAAPATTRRGRSRRRQGPAAAGRWALLEAALAGLGGCRRRGAAGGRSLGPRSSSVRLPPWASPRSTRRWRGSPSSATAQDRRSPAGEGGSGSCQSALTGWSTAGWWSHGVQGVGLSRHALARPR